MEVHRENPFQEIIYEPTDSATDSSLEIKKKEKDKIFKKLSIDTGRKESSNRLKTQQIDATLLEPIQVKQDKVAS